MIAYRAMLDVPRELVHYMSRLLAAERRARGTRRRSRALTCWYQTLIPAVFADQRRGFVGAHAGVPQPRGPTLPHNGMSGAGAAAGRGSGVEHEHSGVDLGPLL